MSGAVHVSCIMPTCNRRRFAGQAIHYFDRQTYPSRELIVIDDGSDPIGDLIPDKPHFRYVRLNKKSSTGRKRNLACSVAQGEIIIHWDDDDWTSPSRIEVQVKALLDKRADLCGISRLLYYDPSLESAWQYSYPKKNRIWLAGGSLCYTKKFWSSNPFPPRTAGEDTRFIWSKHNGKMVIVDHPDIYIALIHDGNTSPKRPAKNAWTSVAPDVVYKVLGNDFNFYRDLFAVRDVFA